ncbi:MAG: sigma-70 family RNA polymerase sigma factor [Bacteroidota bacterium]
MKIVINKSNELTKLIERCKRGERKAQKSLYERYSDKMLAICCRYVGAKQEAEDIMISGFMKVFEKLDQFNQDGSIEGWIRKLMINECLMHIRKYKSVQLVSESNIESENFKVAQVCNYDSDKILSLVQQLPTGYRTVFNMYAIDGYTHKEISGEIGISENTSKSQLCKARNLLKKYLYELELEQPKSLRNYE